MKALVTGANGHLGFNLTRSLAERGYTVRASVRSLADAAKNAALKRLTGVEVVEAELDRPEQLRAAMEGVDVLFHVAAVYSYFPERGVDDMLRASIEGAENALRTAAAVRVPKVVLTSSVVTLPLTKRGSPPSTEADWATDLRSPYIRAKTLGEKRAWEVAEELSIDLVTVLPGVIGGPGFQRNTPSIDLLEGIMKGSMRFGAPNSNLPYVDVRDVVQAHVLAAERDGHGRFIVCNDVFPTLRELSAEMHRIDPRIPAARMVVPDAMLPLAPMLDRLNHRFFGTPRLLTPEFVGTLRGRIWNCSNARIKRELGWTQSISLPQSLTDTIAALRARDTEPGIGHLRPT